MMKDGSEHFVFKNPKESTFKKSHKGCCIVKTNEDGKLYCEDEHLYADTLNEENELKVVFKDGKILKDYSLQEVRNRLHGGKF